MNWLIQTTMLEFTNWQWMLIGLLEWVGFIIILYWIFKFILFRRRRIKNDK